MCFREARIQFHTPRPPDSSVEWEPPGEPFLKLNFDASVAASSQRSGIGIVVRNGAGDIVAWKRKRVDFIVDPEIVEAQAALVAVELAMEKGWMHVIIDGDCLVVIKALNSIAPCLSPAATIFEAIKRKHAFFHSISFSHTSILNSNSNNDLNFFIVLPNLILTLCLTWEMISFYI